MFQLQGPEQFRGWGQRGRNKQCLVLQTDNPKIKLERG